MVRDDPRSWFVADISDHEGLAPATASRKFLEAGKRHLAGDTARVATTDEAKDLRREARALQEVVAEQALELRLLKKHDRGWARPA